MSESFELIFFAVVIITWVIGIFVSGPSQVTWWALASGVGVGTAILKFLIHFKVIP